jgi:O-antigen ligase
MSMQLIHPFDKLISLCAFILIAVLSFLPESAHAKYWLWTTVFFLNFLTVLIWDKGTRDRLFHFRDWPLWLLLVGLLSGTVLATDQDMAWMTYVHIVMAFFLLFYIGKGLFSSPRHRTQVIYFICSCASAVILIGILEMYFHRNVLYEYFVSNPFYLRYVKSSPRAMSTQANPMILGTYLIATLPFSFYLWKQKSRYLRIWGIVLTTTGFGIIFLTYSRGVLLGAIGLLIAYFLLTGRKLFILALAGLIVLCSILCSYSDNPSLRRYSPRRLVYGTYDSVISPYRFSRIRMTEKFLATSPLVGIGFQHFRIRFDEFSSPEENKMNYEFKIPDNMYLAFLAETGIVGTAAFLIFIIAILRRALARLRKIGREGAGLALLLTISALAGLLVNMASYEIFYWLNPLMLFALLCGFMEGEETRTT